MPKLKFENGMTVTLDREPTPQDVEEIATSLGINKPITPSIKPKPRKDVIDAMTGGKDLIPKENWVARGVYQTGKDIAAIPAHFTNQLLLNAPRSIANKAGFDYPEAESGAGDLASKMAGIVGGFKNPIIKAAATAPTLLQRSLQGAAAGGLYTPTEDPVALGQRAAQAAGGAVLPVAGRGIQKTIPIIKQAPNKFFRGGLSQEEAVRIQSQYGNSNASLVDQVKSKLNSKLSEADRTYQSVMDNAPKGKQIDIRPAIQQARTRLKRLGLITDRGNLTELGSSEISRDSVYGKLLDFYKSADALSGVKYIKAKGAVESLTIPQGSKLMAARFKTLVNKDQYTFLRDKLNSLYKNKPSDVDVSKVVNQFYTDGERSGLIGLQKARQLSREAFRNEERFLNRSTGDLKITESKLSRVGAKNPLSKQEIDHIAELEKYVDHPIIKDAANINKLNNAAERIRNLKKYGAGAAAGYVAAKTIGGGGIGRRIATEPF